MMAPLLGGITPGGYLALLQKLYGFYEPLEERIMTRPQWRAAGLDADRRRKSPLLAQDLACLGASTADIAGLPRCRRLPQIENFTQALGCLYVLEGATLGGQVILRHVRPHLGMETSQGGAFFGSYGEDVGPMWKEFGRFVNHYCVQQSPDGLPIRAAGDTFVALRRWLFGAGCGKWLTRP